MATGLLEHHADVLDHRPARGARTPEEGQRVAIDDDNARLVDVEGRDHVWARREVAREIAQRARLEDIELVAGQAATRGQPLGNGQPPGSPRTSGSRWTARAMSAADRNGTIRSKRVTP